MYYALIILATLMFSVGFVLNDAYQKKNGNTIVASSEYVLQTSGITLIIMLCLSKFKIEFSVYSTVMAFLFACTMVTFIYCGIKSLKTANLSVYSMFTMLGGMMLPFISGMLFLGEPPTYGKFICFIFIVASLLLTIDKEKSKKGAIKYYLASFVLNGIYAALASFHQESDVAVNSISFMAMVHFFSVVLCLVILIVCNKKIPTIKVKHLKYSAPYAFTYGIADLILLFALAGGVDASIQYPVVTGGVIVFSTIVACLQKNPMTKKKLIAVVMAVIATIVCIL